MFTDAINLYIKCPHYSKFMYPSLRDHDLSSKHPTYSFAFYNIECKYVWGSWFKLQTSHLFILTDEFLITNLLKKKKEWTIFG